MYRGAESGKHRVRLCGGAVPEDPERAWDAGDGLVHRKLPACILPEYRPTVKKTTLLGGLF